MKASQSQRALWTSNFKNTYNALQGLNLYFKSSLQKKNLLIQLKSPLVFQYNITMTTAASDNTYYVSPTKRSKLGVTEKCFPKSASFRGHIIPLVLQ